MQKNGQVRITLPYNNRSHDWPHFFVIGCGASYDQM
jgi:hypothetical protein